MNSAAAWKRLDRRGKAGVILQTCACLPVPLWYLVWLLEWSFLGWPAIFLTLGLPFFYLVGVVVIIRSKVSRGFKWRAALACPLLLALGIGLAYELNRDPAITFVVPDSYRGPVYVVLDVPDGARILREKERRWSRSRYLFEVDAEGWLWTQAELQNLWQSYEKARFYTRAADGTRQPLFLLNERDQRYHRIPDEQRPAADSIGAFHLDHGWTGTRQGTTSSLPYLLYYIGSYDQLRESRLRREVSSLQTDSLIHAKRQALPLLTDASSP